MQVLHQSVFKSAVGKLQESKISTASDDERRLIGKLRVLVRHIDNRYGDELLSFAPRSFIKLCLSSSAAENHSLSPPSQPHLQLCEKHLY